MWESESESVAGRDYDNEVLNRNKVHGVKTDGFELRDQSWYVDTDVPSDFLVQIGEISFYLHKYPLLSRSGKMNRIIYESREGVELNKIELNDIPGGSDSFELAAKFCYGVAVDLTAANISGLRCAAEYLEMTEDLEEGNLIFKTEAFLSYVVLSSWRDSILVLKSCENLSPWAENLQIVRRCSESIAWKACANPRSIKWSYTGKPSRTSSRTSSPSWNEIKESSPSRSQVQVPSDWWFEDVSILRIDHFVRVTAAIKVKGMRFELIGAVIMRYAGKWLPGLMKEGKGDESSESSSWRGGLHMIIAGNREELPNVQTKEQRMIIESLISIIPPQKDSVSCTFLLRVLRMANMLKVAPALLTELEKRVGMQLEQANLHDLMIPSFNKSETLYDVDLVQRLLEHFLVQEQTELSSPRRSFSEKHGYEGTPSSNVPNAKMRVARLVDGYLTEVARDRNLSLTKFQVIAETLPESSRTCDDGLYRAVDSYLKAHPTVSEHERKRLCRVMDCQKLSLDACMHAAQNERLPLRIVVQVLFSEQIKISSAIANNSLKATSESSYPQPMITTRKALIEGTPQSFQEGWSTAKKDINTLQFELQSVKAKYLELQTDMDNLQRQFDKMSKQKQPSAWTSGWKKLGKLTKITMDNHDIGTQDPNSVHAEQLRKAPRRWRNSIS